MRGENRASRRARRSSRTYRSPADGSYGTYGTRRPDAGRSGSSRPHRGAHAASHKMPRGGAHGGGGREPKKRHLGLKITLGVIGGLLALGIVLFAFLYATIHVPAPEDVALAQKTNVYYSDGTTSIGSYSQQNREIIGCSALPSYVGNAVVSSENRTFWTDPGVDARSIVRALLNNISGGARQGASTITQQYVERYYLGETTTYPGKVKEAILALKIAQTQSKSTVLCNYLNTIYFGRDSYGIQAAAKSYFNKDAKDLSVGESAMLAGIIPAPNAWAPDKNPTKATERYQRTLRIMYADKHISKAQFDEAMKNEPKPVSYTAGNQYSGPNGYLLKLVEQELTRNKTFSSDELATGGYKITTTIDKSKQAVMQKIGDERATGEPDTISHAGVSVNATNGEVEALYGGSDYLKKQLNQSTQAQFQPGSTMKPFALLTGVSQGMSLNSVFDGSSPRSFPGLAQPVKNYDNLNFGRINWYQSVAYSSNTTFVDLNNCVGPQATAATMKKAGIRSTIDKQSLYNVLGINSITAYDLARGYTTIASGGIRRTIHVVRSVTDGKGRQLYKAPTGGTRVFTKQAADLTRHAMEADVHYGFSAPVRTVNRPLASKSGIANDSTAADFVTLSATHATVFAVWNADADGNAAAFPSSFASYAEDTYTAAMFASYAKQAWANEPVKQFDKVSDNGKIGGPQGTWGLRYGTTTWSMGTVSSDLTSKSTTTQQKSDTSKKEDSSSEQGSADGGTGSGDGTDGTGDETSDTGTDSAGQDDGSGTQGQSGGTTGGTGGNTGDAGSDTGGESGGTGDAGGQ
jgi:membrane peptidoglycan carboxypeptidase